VEFASRVVTEGGLTGSPNQAEELLQSILPTEQVRQIMSGVRSRMNEAVWPRLAEIPAPLAAQYLGREHPQIAAFVLSKTPTSLAATVLSQFQQPLRNELMRRLLGNKLVMEPALRLLEQVLRDELLHKIARSSGQNTHARIAGIINKLDRPEMEGVLESLNLHRPKETKIVRGLLFTFEDILRLNETARSVLFADIPPEKVIVALRGADGALRDRILSSLPARTRRIIEQELALEASIPAKEVAKARRAIADFALELLEKGIIELKPDEAE